MSTPVELFGNHEPIGRVAFAEWKVINPTPRLPSGPAAAEVALEAGGGLIAVFGSLREQLHDNRRNGAGNFLQPLGRRGRPPGEVAVHPFHRLRGCKRQNTSKHLVEGDAKCVQIAPGID